MLLHTCASAILQPCSYRQNEMRDGSGRSRSTLLLSEMISTVQRCASLPRTPSDKPPDLDALQSSSSFPFSLSPCQLVSCSAGYTPQTNPSTRAPVAAPAPSPGA